MLELLKNVKSVSYRLYDSQRRCSLSQKPSWLRDCSKHHSIKRLWNSQSAEKIRDFLHGCLKKYTEEPLRVEKIQTVMSYNKY
jgi:rRNA pseudouridine-1189 N-methylase Emg1 (Nep1/Mra1 family)